MSTRYARRNGMVPMAGEDAVLDGAAVERKSHVRAAVAPCSSHSSGILPEIPPQSTHTAAMPGLAPMCITLMDDVDLSFPDPRRFGLRGDPAIG
jgi:hypothetical protein